MKIFCLASLLVLSTLAFKPGEPNTSFNPTHDEGWVELINGKDFTGWRATENTATWFVANGLYEAVGKRSHLFYEGEHLKDGFKNFELEVQVKTFKLANTGIYFHTAYQEKNWPNQGMEIQVNNTHIGEGDYIELKKTASLYGIRNVYKAFGKDGEWMTLKARVESNRVQIWLNGIQTVDYLQPENAKKQLVKGTFSLQGHDSLSRMLYKSFKVRRLPDDARSNLAAPVLGAWHDSLVVLQGRQFAFIDLNPKTNLSAQKLADYFYTTGINVSLVKSPATVKELAAAKNLPLFTGLKVNATNHIKASSTAADYVVGVSTDAKTARTLLAGKKINIWSHKGSTLTSDQFDELLNIASRNNVAVEIDNVSNSPSVEFITMAKAKGCKFSFAGLVPASNMQKSMYVVRAIKEAGLTYKDLYIPGW